MSVKKIKLISNQDIRIIKIQKDSLEKQLQSIINNVEKKFGLEPNSFVLRYKDDEGDLITLSDATDLEEAYDVNGLPKIYVEQKNKPSTGEDVSNNTNEKEQKVEDKVRPCICGDKLECVEAIKCYSGGVVECDECGISLIGNKKVYHCIKKKSSNVHKGGYDLCEDCVKGIKKITFDQFIRDIKRNNKLKQEVEKFLVEFLSFVKKSNTSIKESFNEIIKKYKALNTNEYVQKVCKENLDLLASKYEDLVKFIAKNINPNDALIYFDMILTSCNNIKTFVLGIPPFKFLFDGLDKNNGDFNFNWGQTDDGNKNDEKNTNDKETKEEKQQRKINEKKLKLEKKKQKLLEKLKKLEEEENNLSKPQEENKTVKKNNKILEEEMSEEFQILENNQINEPEIEIMNEEPKEIELEEEQDIVEEFVYQDKLDQVKSMGFSNTELIKALLLKYNGNTAQTVNDMLSA